jgi:hypothetical protein
MSWGSRPRGCQYCGIDEFDDAYYICEIRNGDNFECTSYLPRDDAHNRHSCDTCTNLRKTSERYLLTLKETMKSEAESDTIFTGELQPALRTQAIDEYQSCVDNAGLVFSPPAFLPYCAAYGSDPEHESYGHFVIGPVVNSDACCTRWQPRTEPADPPDAELEALVRHAKRLEEVASSVFTPKLGAPSWADVYAAVCSTKADIVAYCLRKLFVPEEFVSTICTSTPWGSRWRQEPFTGAEFLPENQAQSTGAGAQVDAPIRSSGEVPSTSFQKRRGPWARLHQRAAAPSVPGPTNEFLVIPGVRYTHPAHPEVALTIVNAAPRVIAVVDCPAGRWEYDLSSFPWNMWTELKAQATGVRIAVYVQLPVAIYVNW